MTITRGAILIILFFILFSSFSVAANEDEVIVKCREAIYNLDVSPPFVVATLFDGTVQVFDTTGAVVHDIDLKLAVPSIEEIISWREETAVYVDVDYDFAIFFPKNDKFVVARVRYSQSQSPIWQRTKNSLKSALGMGSSIEVWDVSKGELIYKESVNGFLTPKEIALNGNSLAYIANEGIVSTLHLADIEKQEILAEKRVSISVLSSSIFEDKLYVLDEKKLNIYGIDNVKGLKRLKTIDLGCNFHPFFVFDQKSSFTGETWAFNSCMDSTIGNIRFVGDSAMYAKCRELLNMTVLGAEPSGRPFGYIQSTGELILAYPNDTLQLVDFNRQTVRSHLISDIVDTSKYFLPISITEDHFYSRRRFKDYGDSTFAILRIDL